MKFRFGLGPSRAANRAKDPVNGFADRLPLLKTAIEERFCETTLEGTWPRRVIVSILTRGGQPALASIALVAPEGDLQSALVMGEIRADRRAAAFRSYSRLAHDHAASLKGVLDLEQQGYDALLADLAALLQAHDVPAEIEPYQST